MKIILLFVIAPLLFLSSCMNFTEKLYINADGSGKYSFDIDMNQLVDMMKMMDESQADSLQNAYQEEASKESDYAKFPGITNAKGSFDKTTNKLTNSFDFSTIQALNGAWNNMEALSDNADMEISKNNFKKLAVSKKTYTIDLNIKELREGLSEGNEEDMEMMKSFMEENTYSFEMHFASPIKSFKGDNLIAGDDNKTVVYSVSLKVLLFDNPKEKISISVKLK